MKYFLLYFLAANALRLRDDDDGFDVYSDIITQSNLDQQMKTI